MTTPLLVELDAPPPWRGVLEDALTVAGVNVSSRAGAGLGVAVAAQRSVTPLADQWSVASRPHLLVAVWDHLVEVGPWVEPGVGPCARCVEASTLHSQSAEPLPSPTPWLLALAGSWIAREVRTWHSGRTPATWGQSWGLTDDPVPSVRRWQRHPYCGCAWYESA